MGGRSIRGAVALSASIVASVLVATVATTVFAPDVGADSAAGGFVAVTPSRLLDTRQPGQGVCVHGGSPRALKVTSVGGVPADASAVVLNVTVARSNENAFLTVYPAGVARPGTSTLNFTRGSTVANATTVRPGTGGQIQLFTPIGCAPVIVDVVGYHASGTPVAEGGFASVTPARRYDSRSDPLGCVRANQPRTIRVAGASGVPANAAAVAMNVTVTGPTGTGHLTVYPAYAPRPTASSLNFSRGQTVANAVTSRTGGDIWSGPGYISVFNNVGCAHVVVDVLGYYAANSPLAEGGFAGVNPSRLLDTRQPGQGGCLARDAVRSLQVSGRGGVPGTAKAVVLNVTATRPRTAGFLTVFPTGVARPTASSVNFEGNQTVPNAVTVGLGTGGKINLVAGASCADAIVDVVGYFTNVPPRGDQLVQWKPTVSKASLGNDRIVVHGCDTGPGTAPNPTAIRDWATANIAPYFAAVSRGRYTQTFVAGSTFSATSDGACLTEAQRRSTGSATNTLVFGSDPSASYGFAGPGTIWSDGDAASLSPATPPSTTGRGGFIGGGSFVNDKNPGLVIHELGHTLHWPHSFIGPGNEYDNPTDLMSGWTELSTCPRAGGGFFTCKAQNTIGFNRLSSGWIDAAQTVVHTGGTRTLNLAAPNTAGTQMVMAPSRTSMKASITIEARPATGYDAILSKAGVAVHVVDQRTAACGSSGSTFGACISLWRRQGQAFGTPTTVGGIFAGGYTHVLAPGESRTVHGLTITAGAAVAGGYSVTVSGAATIPATPLPFSGRVVGITSFDPVIGATDDIGTDSPVGIAPVSGPHGPVTAP